nr:NADH dehydrogenase subunit 4L [Petillopsis calcar]
MLLNIVVFFMFFIGLVGFSLNHKHLLLSLFNLEYLVVIIFFTFLLFLLKFGFELYFILIFLTFSVCEGALGLSVLVSMIRSHGNDLLSSMSVLSW